MWLGHWMRGHKGDGTARVWFDGAWSAATTPKTAGLWTSTPRPDGALAWTTLAGRDYVTYPKNWRESLHDEPAAPETSTEDEPHPSEQWRMRVGRLAEVER